MKHLPTLTRTPLPTLSPAPVPSSGQAIALTPAPVLVAPTPAPVLVPTITPASSDVPASTLPAPQANSGPTLTALVVLNVRAGPGVDYPILGKLAPSQSFQIIGKNPEGTWWQIVYPPGTGSLAWVSGDAQFSTANAVEAVQIAQLPPPPPPTATPIPTPIPTVQPTQLSTPAGAPTALPAQTAVPAGNPTVGPTATPVSVSAGWAFAGVRVYTDQYEDGLLLYGNLINSTGSAQKLETITGTFYDVQGQVAADADRTSAYWPAYVIPPDGGVPFALTVDDIDSAANFNFSAEAEPSSENPRQDFEFLDVSQGSEDDAYCVGGNLRNPGSGLEKYLIIAVVLYDGQDNVVNFGDYTEYGPTQVVGDEALDFEICVDPPNQEVARYELRAWGL